MKKQYIVLFVLICLLGIFLSFSADAERYGTIGGCWWTLDDNGVLEISGTEMSGYGNAYQYPWYSDRQQITKIVLDDHMVSISMYAFSGCSNITSINLPSSLRRIEAYAFQGCTGLKEIIIPASVGSNLDAGVFSGCSSLKKITFRGGYVGLSEYLFENCISLDQFSIPSGVQNIGKGVFKGCTGLRNMVLPDSVVYLKSEAFSGCSSLVSVTLSSQIKKIDDDVFSGCINLSSVTIPSSVTSLGSNCFRDCVNLTEVTIPNGCTSINSEAFYNCQNLIKAVVPATVQNVGALAFSECPKLTIYSSCASTALEYAEEGNIPYITVHEWHTPEYTWKTDNTEVEAKHICIHNEEHFEIETVGTDYEIIVPAGCVDGVGLFTSKGFCIPEFIVQTKEIVLPGGTGHVPVVDETVEPSDYLPGYTEGSHCSVCGQILVEQQYIHPLVWRTDENEEGLTILEYYGTYKNLSIPESLGGINVIKIADGAFAEDSCPSRVYIPNGITFEDQAFDQPVIVHCFQYSEAYYKARRLDYNVACADNLSFFPFYIFSFPEYFQLERGESREIEYTVWPITGQEQFEWRSNYPERVSVDNGIVTANLPGDATISLLIGDYSCSVIVRSWCDADAFTLAETDLYIETERYFQITVASVEPEGANLTLTWQSSNADIVEMINESGRIKAWSIGDTVVTATSHNGIIRNCTVHVCYPVETVVLSMADNVIAAGSSVQLTATAITRNQQYTNKLVTFYSSNKNILSIDKNGLIKALNPGVAVVTAITASGKSDSIEITVVHPNVDEMEILLLPEQLAIIEDEAFLGSNCEAVIIPDLCKRIESKAFANCENLKYVRIPKNVTYIADDAFENSNNVYLDYVQ